LNTPNKNINPKLRAQIENALPQYSIKQLVDGIHNRDRFAISQAITLVESEAEHDQDLAVELLSKLKVKNPAFRIVITGAPGVGKSTFVNAFGHEVIKHKKTLAVLATDPSSQISKGSILGDKTRMFDIQNADEIYIRPSATANHLGGVSKKSLEKMDILEAAGFDLIILETVGVGQSEFASYQLSDLFILLINPGAGDELQGMKRGIVEMADMVCINKADGTNLEQAQSTKKAYENASRLLSNPRLSWQTQFFLISALEHKGIDTLWEAIDQYYNDRKASGLLMKNRVDLEAQLLKSKATTFLLDQLKVNTKLNSLINKNVDSLKSKQSTLSQTLISLKKSVSKLL